MNGSRRLWLAFVAVAVLASACTPRSDDDRPPAASGRPVDAVDARILRELGTLWTYVEADAGGYGDAVDLDDPPSLYATAWNLRLAREVGVRLPGIDRAATATWLRTELRDEAPPAPGKELLPRLHRAWLAAQGLAVLGHRPPAADVEQLVGALRVSPVPGGSGPPYAVAAGQPGSWAATQTAVELLDLAHVPVPGEVTAAVRAALPGVATTADDTTMLDVAVPLWQLASRLLDRSVREREAPSLRALVARATARASTSAGLSSGVSLGVLVAVRDIAAANGVALTRPDVDRFSSLASPDGYLALSEAEGAARVTGDPQVTFNAARLGWRAPRRLTETLARNAGDRGWRDGVTTAKPETSYYATVVSHALGSRVRDREVEALLRRRWFGDAAAKIASSAGAASAAGGAAAADAAAAKDTYFVVALGRTLDVDLPVRLRNAVRARLAEGRAEAAEAMWLARTAVMLGLRVDGSLASSITPPEPLRSMPDAYASDVVGRIAGSARLRELARSRARELVSGSAFRYSDRAPGPDLVSTAMGARIAGWPESERSRAFALFAGPRGARLEPPGDRPDASRTPRTIYAGFLLAGRVVDTAGLY